MQEPYIDIITAVGLLVERGVLYTNKMKKLLIYVENLLKSQGVMNIYLFESKL